MSKSFYVYAHKRATDGRVFYVGKGCGPRAWQVAGRGEYWNRIAKKYGVAVEIVQSGMQEWWALELEKELIALHGKELLCNLTDGGETSSGYRFTDEAKAKISAGNKGKIRTPELRAKLKALFNTDEHRRKISIAVNTPAVRAIMARSNARNKGKPLTERQRAVLVRMNSPEIKAKAILALSCPEKKRQIAAAISKATRGKIFAPHILSAARAANIRPIVCVDTGVGFDSITTAVEWLKRDGWPKAAGTAIVCAAKKVRGYSKAYGYQWQYAAPNTPEAAWT